MLGDYSASARLDPYFNITNHPSLKPSLAPSVHGIISAGVARVADAQVLDTLQATGSWRA